jgi:DNA-binding NarL/FixJ family response regulator
MVDVARPSTAPRDSPAAGTIRVVVAVPHPMLRAAIASLIESDAEMTLVGSTGDVLGTARCLSEHHPDVLLVASSLALIGSSAAIGALRSLAPGVAVLVAGMETDPAYFTAARAAGAVAFMPLDTPPADMLVAVRQAACSRGAASARLSGGGEWIDGSVVRRSRSAGRRGCPGAG